MRTLAQMQSSPSEFAAALRSPPFSLSKTFAWALACGKRMPSLKLAVLIQRELGVPCEYWVDDISHPQTDTATGTVEAISGNLAGEFLGFQENGRALFRVPAGTGGGQ